VDRSGCDLGRRIVSRAGLGRAIEELLGANQVSQVVLGDGTQSRSVAAELKAALGDRLPAIELVNERDSTLEARALYFADHPPRGVWWLLPLSMQTPGEAYDDYAALVLARRYQRLSGLTGGGG
jgi:hypothetical protein